jgi:hypothetical protein
MSDPFSNQEDPFMAGGGGGAPVATFEAIGDTVTGVVTAVDQRTDILPDGTAKTWPDGKPMAVFVFTLDTDDGERRLFVRGNMVTAIREAASAAGFRTVIGQQITVKHHALGEKKPGKFPAKLYKAKVEPAPPKAAKPAAPVEEPW